jgi:hypothetical protein
LWADGAAIASKAPLPKCVTQRHHTGRIRPAVQLGENATEVRLYRQQREGFGRNDRAANLDGFVASSQIERLVARRRQMCKHSLLFLPVQKIWVADGP